MSKTYTDLLICVEENGFSFLGNGEPTTPAWACSRSHFGISLYDAAGNFCRECENHEHSFFDRRDRVSLASSESPYQRSRGR